MIYNCLRIYNRGPRHNNDLLDSFSPNQFKTKERLISHIRDLNVVNDKSEITILEIII